MPLYVISTPIGNLKDISLRAIDALAVTDIILCEDTRKTRNLLQSCQIETQAKLLSFHEHNERQRLPQIIDSLQKKQKIVLVTNAGTPLISDPGFKLIQECIKNKLNFEVIPGPSAVWTSLIYSGFPANNVLFLGFLPKKQTQKKKVFDGIKMLLTTTSELTIIFFESPHRLLKTLDFLKNEFDNVSIAICREITKMFEEIRRESVNDSIRHFLKTRPKGEFTIVLLLKAKFSRLKG